MNLQRSDEQINNVNEILNSRMWDGKKSDQSWRERLKRYESNFARPRISSMRRSMICNNAALSVALKRMAPKQGQEGFPSSVPDLAQIPSAVV
jgi:hypothetical protein